MSQNPYQSPRHSGQSQVKEASSLAALAGLPRWVLGGVLGGGAGALVWAIVGAATHYEIGWIAWGVGFLTGVGLRYAAFLGDDDESTLQGVLAGGISLLAVLAGKVAAGWLGGFVPSLTPFDLLWLGLAVVTAYKIGVGSYNTD